MNAQDAAVFADAHAKLAALRRQSEVQERFDAALATVMPLISAGIGAGATAASSFLPGGPLVAAGVALGSTFLEDAIHRWLASRAPKGAPS